MKPQVLAISGTMAANWLHSADQNVLRFIAEKIGHQFPSKPWAGKLQTFLNGGWTKSSVRDDYVWTLIEKIIATGRAGEDIAAATLLDRSHAWYPMVRHWCQLLYSMDPENLSTGDAGNYTDSGINLPVQAGYGADRKTFAAFVDSTRPASDCDYGDTKVSSR